MTHQSGFGSSIDRSCVVAAGPGPGVALPEKGRIAPRPAAAADAAAAPAPITLALNWLPEPEFGGFYAAREDGAYKKAGLDVKVQGGGAGVPVVQMVATGRADFGTVTADELVLARARGGDVVAVFATFQTAPHGIMVHASRGLKKLEDAFDSGTLALETGLPYIAYLRQKFHWGAAKIVAYDGGIAHFLTDPMFGQQCYVTSEPILARQKGSDPQVFLIADAGFNPYTTIVITQRRAAAEESRAGAGVRRRDRRRVARLPRQPGPDQPAAGHAEPRDGRVDAGGGRRRRRCRSSRPPRPSGWAWAR